MNYNYKFHLYINARHLVELDGVQSSIHPHTWEIGLLIKVNKDDFLNFTFFEKALEDYLKIYDGKYLNDVESFQGLNPTVENIGKVLFEGVSHLLKDEDLILTRLEISENPTRTYIIEV